jgi:hypothetical protein
VLRARRGACTFEAAPEGDAEPLRPKMACPQRPVRRIENGREIDVDSDRAQRLPGVVPSCERVGDGAVARSRTPRRQLGQGPYLSTFLVGEDERSARPPQVPVPPSDDDSADAGRRRQARDHDERGLLVRGQLLDRGLWREDGSEEGNGGGQRQSARRLAAPVDLELTDEQRLIQDTVRSFVDERVLPNAVENDLNHHLDMSVIESMAELGLLGIVIPEEYGGAGLDFVAEALACEEIERGESAFRTLISVHVGLNSLSLLRYGSEEQKERYLTPQARGERIACFGLTEPAAGSDVASMRTTARREGDVYVLNGQKNWISYAQVADHQLVFAKTDPEARHRGISAFLVERDWPGVTTAEMENKLGVWAGSTGELFFQNVEVPAENLVGEEGQGFEIAMYGLDQGRFTVAAGACGVIRACLESPVE